jgi:hypothetical protein
MGLVTFVAKLVGEQPDVAEAFKWEILNSYYYRSFNGEKNAKSCAQLLACAVKVDETIAIDPAVNALFQAGGPPTLYGVKQGLEAILVARAAARAAAGPDVCTLLAELTPGRGRHAPELCPPHRQHALWVIL